MKPKRKSLRIVGTLEAEHSKTNLCYGPETGVSPGRSEGHQRGQDGWNVQMSRVRETIRVRLRRHIKGPARGQIKVLATKPGNVSSIPRSHRLSSGVQTCRLSHTHKQTNKKKIYKVKGHTHTHTHKDPGLESVFRESWGGKRMVLQVKVLGGGSTGHLLGKFMSSFTALKL